MLSLSTILIVTSCSKEPFVRQFCFIILNAVVGPAVRERGLQVCNIGLGEDTSEGLQNHSIGIHKQDARVFCHLKEAEFSKLLFPPADACPDPPTRFDIVQINDCCALVLELLFLDSRDTRGTGDNPGDCCSINAQFLVVEELVCYNSRGVEVSEVVVLTC